MKNKDLQGLYEYIVNNVNDKDIKEFITYLQDYVYNGSVVDFESCGNHILDIALTREVKYILTDMGNERIDKLSEDKLDYVASGIAYEIVHYNDSIWEHIDSFVDYVKEDYLRDLESESAL